jgi:phosphoglycerate dehydrogenase-like enzyme
MKYRCAILDDYQNVALSMADWASLEEQVETTAFLQHFATEDEVVEALQGYQIVVIMRERTPFGKSLFERLPELKLLITSGMPPST